MLRFAALQTPSASHSDTALSVSLHLPSTAMTFLFLTSVEVCHLFQNAPRLYCVSQSWCKRMQQFSKSRMCMTNSSFVLSVLLQTIFSPNSAAVVSAVRIFIVLHFITLSLLDRRAQLIVHSVSPVVIPFLG